ncbi:MAG: DNA N-6-adenine-methyltransferase [Janthinobacterium lividum]
MERFLVAIPSRAATLPFPFSTCIETALRQKRFSSPLGVELQQARKACGLTQSVLATRVGISLPSVRAAERGSGSLTMFTSLADALGVEIGGRSLPPGDTLGGRLAALRKRRELGRRTVAKVAGISPTTLQALENENGGHLATLISVGEALGAQLQIFPKGQAVPFWSGPALSSAHQAWTTPPTLLEKLYGVVDGPFDLDPCSPVKRGPRAPVKARLRYTVQDDGLSLPWRARLVFVNPPYGRSLKLWVTKAHSEVAAGRAQVVFALVPARSDTAWWHEHCARHADVWSLRGRLSFGAGGQPAPFPSALVVWGAHDELRTRMTTAFPEAWHVPSNPERGAASAKIAA